MPRYEYKIIPAPTKGRKGKGVKGAEARFANALQQVMNTQGGYGWEYQRAETLPSVERSGLTGSVTEWRHVLVFRRIHDDDTADFAPELLPPPDIADDTANEAVSTPEPAPTTPPSDASETPSPSVSEVTTGRESGADPTAAPSEQDDVDQTDGSDEKSPSGSALKGIPRDIMTRARNSIKPDR